MTGWITIDPASLAVEEKQHKHGVAVVVGVSPFDIPEAVRSFYDESLGRLVIEFKYLEKLENVAKHFEDQDVSLLVGKHSGRIHQVLVNTNSLKDKKLNVGILPNVDDALDNLARMNHYRGHSMSLNLAKAAIENKEKELLAEI